MILATHAIAGAILANQLPDYPIIGFLIAFGSHFVLDAIPHWDYPILSLQRDSGSELDNKMEKGRNFYLDILRTGADFAFGIAVALYILGNWNFPLPVLAGAIGGVLPDALQLAYWKIRTEPLISLQRFHIFIHARGKIGKALPGLIFQAGILAALYLFIK